MNLQTTQKMFDYLIVGAGLAGATCARLLSRQGYKILVIDKSNHIGGNCYTENRDGIEVHLYGAHIFHTDNERVLQFLSNYTKFNSFINSPIAITEDKEIYNLPFNMNTFSKMFGVCKPVEVKEIIDNEIAEYKKIHPNINNLQDQAINMVGTTVFNKLIKGYTEKQWNDACYNLDPSIIKRLPLRFTYDNNYFNDKYQCIPAEGYTKMMENMLSSDNITVWTEVDFKKHKNILERIAKYIIYTGRIDEYYDYQFGELEYRSLNFMHVKLDTDNNQGNAVVNYTGHDVGFTRRIEHRHFDKNCKSDVTWVSTEFPTSLDEKGIPCYPVNNEKNNTIYRKYKELADSQSSYISFAGRLGCYKYFDMDDVILDCMNLCSDLVK